MARPMSSTPRRESATVDESLRREAAGPETDRCGYCGGTYLVTPDTFPGVCPYDFNQSAYGY